MITQSNDHRSFKHNIHLFTSSSQAAPEKNATKSKKLLKDIGRLFLC